MADDSLIRASSFRINLTPVPRDVLLIGNLTVENDAHRLIGRE